MIPRCSTPAAPPHRWKENSLSSWEVRQTTNRSPLFCKCQGHLLWKKSSSFIRLLIKRYRFRSSAREGPLTFFQSQLIVPLRREVVHGSACPHAARLQRHFSCSMLMVFIALISCWNFKRAELKINLKARNVLPCSLPSSVRGGCPLTALPHSTPAVSRAETGDGPLSSALGKASTDLSRVPNSTGPL